MPSFWKGCLMSPSPSSYAHLPATLLCIVGGVTLAILALQVRSMRKQRKANKYINAADYALLWVLVALVLSCTLPLPFTAEPTLHTTAGQAPTWSQHNSVVVGSVVRTVTPTDYNRYGNPSRNEFQDSVVTEARHRVVLKKNSGYLDGDPIAYGCEPKSVAVANTSTTCFEAAHAIDYHPPFTRMWLWWTVPLMYSMLLAAAIGILLLGVAWSTRETKTNDTGVADSVATHPKVTAE